MPILVLAVALAWFAGIHRRFGCLAKRFAAAQKPCSSVSSCPACLHGDTRHCLPRTNRVFMAAGLEGRRRSTRRTLHISGLSPLYFAMSCLCTYRRLLSNYPPLQIREHSSFFRELRILFTHRSSLQGRTSGLAAIPRWRPDFVAPLAEYWRFQSLNTALSATYSAVKTYAAKTRTRNHSIHSVYCTGSTAVRDIDRSVGTMNYSKSTSKHGTASLFDELEEAAPDPVLGVEAAYAKSTAKEKVNLGVGAYRTEEGKPYVFRCVRKVEAQLAADTSLSKEYLPIDGIQELKRASQEVIFGENSPAVREGRICSVQSISGTGALRVAAEFIRTFISGSTVAYMSNPTWANHPNIFKKAGFEVVTHPYWDPTTRGVDFDGMMKTLEGAAPRSVLVLHTCAHNPTGVDLNESQWRQLLKVCQTRRLIPILDTAYQGYASGDLKRDRFSVELFCSEGCMEMFVCQSFAKNMGLYGERAGMLHIVCASTERAGVVLSQVKKVIRPMYSSPPLHGGLIACRLLTDPSLRAEWEAELKQVSERVQHVRSALRIALEKKGTPGTWKHITDQIGMFSYTGLTPDQCERLTNHWHIFLMRNGRISLAGLNKSNVDYVASAIDEVVRALPFTTSRI